MFSLSDYQYELPDALIAQSPLSQRSASRLMVLDRSTGQTDHRHFHDLPALVRPGDLIVLNDTRVIPGRLMGRKDTGGRVEVLILDYEGGMANLAQKGAFVSECLVSASKRVRRGQRIHFDDNWRARVTGGEGPTFTLTFEGPEPVEQLLASHGNVPLPPYIRRNGTPPPVDDKSAYQTVYATRDGAIAAPTAGLHFTPELLSRIQAAGAAITRITLHVGYGTFVPVRVADIREHVMHTERYHIQAETADRLNAVRTAGGRVIAVGTTSVRTLEHAAEASGRVLPGSGQCDLFIYPGYRFKVVDAMITNFHLPESTLLMLVSAFCGRERILSAYREAVERRYRFFSYGDAMFIHTPHHHDGKTQAP